MGRVFLIVFLSLICCVFASKRNLNIKDGKGPKVHLSTFTYLAGGQLLINITDMFQPPASESSGFVFTLEKILRHPRKPPELVDYQCEFSKKNRGPVVIQFNRNSSRWKGRNYQSSLTITNGTQEECRPSHETVSDLSDAKEDYVLFQSPPDSASNVLFTICFSHSQDEGQYAFFLRSCQPDATYSFKVSLVEQNPGPNYLPAGDMPLPMVYALLTVIFGCAANFWIVYLCRNEATVFKIHYLMFVLILLKTLALMFHSMDYYFISVDGSPMQTFAMLFYITYLTKGALLFSTLALVGSGWAFIKTVLSDKEKKVFLLVIPLQVFANVAYIITDVSEEGDNLYVHWRKMFMVVDMLCCVAIIFPVKWSIKYLQSTAETDGKAAINLRKLHLFNKYYIMVVAYFYLTRIFSLVLRAILPPNYSWIHELFFETITLAFFVITAYSFRPGADNPYLQLPTEDEFDLEFEEVTTQSAGNNTTHRVNHEKNHVNNHVTNHAA